jgi:hypothetical protein
MGGILQLHVGIMTSPVLKKSRCKIPLGKPQGTFIAVGKSPRVRVFTGIMAPSEAEPPSVA